MLPLNRILCTTDFNEPSYEALRVANELAFHFSSELFVIHIVSSVPIVPATPQSRLLSMFLNISRNRRCVPGKCLKTWLFKRLNDPDYKYIINTSTQYKANEPQLHWYLQIRPRLTTQAGFEIGSGISINPSFPEEDADFLKKEEE